MTKIDKNWKAKEEAKRAFLSNQGIREGKKAR
mgnify:CR=1 FL=1